MARRRDYREEYRKRTERYQQKFGVSYNKYRYWKSEATELGIPKKDFDYMASRSDRFLSWEEMQDLIKERKKSQWGNQSLQGQTADEFISDFYSITPTDDGFDIDAIPDDVIEQWMGWASP